MSEKTNSEALDKLFEIDGELWGSPSLVRMARIRASILHASSAWGSSDDGALIGALADEVERLREALRWALAELNGTTRYDNDEQRENCFAQAEAALRADKAGQDAAERLDEAGQATRHIRRDGMTDEQIEALERLIRMIVRDEMQDNYYFDFLRAKEEFTACFREMTGE